MYPATLRSTRRGLIEITSQIYARSIFAQKVSIKVLVLPHNIVIIVPQAASGVKAGIKRFEELRSVVRTSSTGHFGSFFSLSFLVYGCSLGGRRI